MVFDGRGLIDDDKLDERVAHVSEAKQIKNVSCLKLAKMAVDPARNPRASLQLRVSR